MTVKLGAKAEIEKGLKDLRSIIDMARASMQEFYREAEELIAESKPEVPVDTGALRNSGYVEQPQVSGNKITVRCGYGGPAAGYALYVHENLEANHPVGKAKYLEDPFNRRLPGLSGRMAARLEKRLQKAAKK